MAMLGFSGRVWTRWCRWAGLSLSPSPALPLIRAAYGRGLRDALDSLALSERERLIGVFKDSHGSERPDAVLAHKAVADAIRRAHKQLDSMERMRAEGRPEEMWCGGAKRLKNIKRELSYLSGEDRPAAEDLPWPPRMNPNEDGRIRAAEGRRGAGANEGQPTGSKEDDEQSDSGHEWYAHEGEQQQR